MDESSRIKLLSLQRMEATEAEVYRRLGRLHALQTEELDSRGFVHGLSLIHI